MVGKLETRDSGTYRQFKPQIYQGKEGNRVEIFMIDVIVINKVSKIGIDKIAEIEGFNLVNKVEIDQVMSKLIGIVIGEEILEVMWEHTKYWKTE